MKDALIKMHIAVFLWGFTGVLGKAISLAEFPLTWYRTGMTALLFLVVILYRREFRRLSLKEIARFFAIGSIIAIHWVAFYGSIKYANASIALTCLATAGIFTAIMEPILLKTKFKLKEMWVGLMALIGMYCIYRFEFKYALGIGLGVSAAILSALFTLMNKKIINQYPARLVGFYEISSGFVFLCILLPLFMNINPSVSFSPSLWDWIWLFVLSLVCTVWAQSLALSALKVLSPFTTVLMVNLEPVYGIVLAMIFFKENKDLGWGFYLGILLIALSVALHTFYMVKARRASQAIG